MRPVQGRTRPSALLLSPRVTAGPGRSWSAPSLPGAAARLLMYAASWPFDRVGWVGEDREEPGLARGRRVLNPMPPWPRIGIRSRTMARGDPGTRGASVDRGRRFLHVATPLFDP